MNNYCLGQNKILIKKEERTCRKPSILASPDSEPSVGTAGPWAPGVATGGSEQGWTSLEALETQKGEEASHE